MSRPLTMSSTPNPRRRRTGFYNNSSTSINPLLATTTNSSSVLDERKKDMHKRMIEVLHLARDENVSEREFDSIMKHHEIECPGFKKFMVSLLLYFYISVSHTTHNTYYLLLFTTIYYLLLFTTYYYLLLTTYYLLTTNHWDWYYSTSS